MLIAGTTIGQAPSVFICNLMRIGRWSELSVDRVCREHEVMREAYTNETSGKLVLGGTVVGCPS